MELSEVLKNLEPIAEALKIGVGEIWQVFYRKYLVKGLSELVVIVILGVIIYLTYHIKTVNSFTVPICTIAGLGYLFDAINLIGNPKYYALTEIYDLLKKGRY